MCESFVYATRGDLQACAYGANALPKTRLLVTEPIGPPSNNSANASKPNRAGNNGLADTYAHAHKKGSSHMARPLETQAERPRNPKLLQGDGGAGLLELLLGVLGVLLLGTLEQDGGGSLHLVLGLLQAEAGESADNLDDGDLVGAEGSELNVEVGLLLLLGSSSASSGGSGNGDGGSGGYAEDVLQLVDELRKLEGGHLLEGLDDLFLGSSHANSPLNWGTLCALRFVW